LKRRKKIEKKFINNFFEKKSFESSKLENPQGRFSILREVFGSGNVVEKQRGEKNKLNSFLKISNPKTPKVF